MTTSLEPPRPEQIETTRGPYDPEMKEAGQLTSPTWELELFLSGAFVFATFQLPGLIESFFQKLAPHAIGASTYVLFIGSLYGKAIAFTLIAMFSVHLVMRAYWVALMGLQSVFPKGIRWDELKMGPIARDVYRSRVPDLSKTIERLDNICSVVFSAGLMLVLFFVFATGFAGTLGGLGYLLAQLIHRPAYTQYFFFGLVAVLVGPALIAGMWDKRAGNRYAPGSRQDRLLRRLLNATYSANAVRFTGPMLWTLMSNVGRKKALALFYVLIMALIALAAADRLAQSDRLSVNSYDFFATSRNHGVDYHFYDNLRGDDKPFVGPSIQSDIIKDPYVRLFIPISPRRDNAALPKLCPGLKPIQDRGVQIGADSYVADSLTTPVLDCLAKLHAVTLDGAARPDLQFSFYERPETGIKGVVAYIPVDSLSRGRHDIGVVPSPPEELPTDTAALRKQAWKRPLVIPFWR